jgi:hypothetical protein
VAVHRGEPPKAWIATAFGLAMTDSAAWIATAFGLAMTDSAAWIATAFGLAMTDSAAWIATAFGLAMTDSAAWIATLAVTARPEGSNPSLRAKRSNPCCRVPPRPKGEFLAMTQSDRSSP